MRDLNILIIGGGIAGCSAAIALSDRGHRVEIVEKQTEWRFQSSGIFVYSNGLKSMQALGLLPQIMAAGFVIPDGRNVYLDNRGAPIVETTYPSADEGQIPAILGIKRAEMHRVMASRVADLGVKLRLGVTVETFADKGDTVDVVFSDGTTGCFDLVVGADGLRSATRAMMGFDVKPRYTGFGVWRSVHTRPPQLRDKIMMMGPAKRYGIMPISEDKLYTFGTVAEPENAYYPPEDWPGLMRARFAEFDGPVRAFLDELGPESETLYTAVEEVVMPLPWHQGKVLLIGDAAHAGTPFMGQGGAMAMQDAVVLAQALEKETELGAALSNFGAARFPVCKFVQDVSRAVGEAGAQEIEGGDMSARNEKLKDTAQQAVDGFYGKLDALNREAEKLLC